MNKDQVIVDLLTEIIDLWEQDFSAVEIGSDVKKIELLNRAVGTVNPASVSVPDRVLKLYERVYLKNVWGRESNSY